MFSFTFLFIWVGLDQLLLKIAVLITSVVRCVSMFGVCWMCICITKQHLIIHIKYCASVWWVSIHLTLFVSTHRHFEGSIKGMFLSVIVWLYFLYIFFCHSTVKQVSSIFGNRWAVCIKLFFMLTSWSLSQCIISCLVPIGDILSIYKHVRCQTFGLCHQWTENSLQ